MRGENKLNIVVILSNFIVTIFFLQNIYCYKKNKVIYAIKSNSFVIIDDKYFSLQLGVSIINSISLIILSINYSYFKISSGYTLCFLLVFWLFNYMLKGIAILKKYAKINE